MDPLPAVGNQFDASGHHGLLHSDVPDESWVDLLNAQVCRFAYEAVIAQSTGHENMIAQYADISPVHDVVPKQVATGVATIHRQLFGPRKTDRHLFPAQGRADI